jgi:phosphohistidine swiveling domain-containing protein
MDIVALSAINDRMIDLVGGKAAGLGALIKAGENVPAGFCVTTNVFRRGELPRTAVVDAYRHLGGGPVAVRSSATAEDLPDASFAGQHETVLGVSGEEALITAIRTCWQSLDTPRAIAYREARWRVDEPAAMAVVVQRMVDPVAAGVAFTANPITGTRIEIVIDAVAGLGMSVVDGSVAADHYVLSDGQPVTAGGSLSAEQLEELRRTGRRVERSLGGPQDLEWAFDRQGKLWLLQARPITTIFPVPSDARRDDLRVYLETGHMQGMRRPITPMGMSVLTSAGDRWLEAFGFGTSRGYVLAIAGRMFLDITGMVRDRRLRARLPQMLGIYGPGVARAVDRLLTDPRLATRSGRAIDYTAVARIVAKVAPGLLLGAVRSLMNPTAARRRAFREADGVAVATPPQPATVADRIEAAAVAQDVVLGGPMTRMLPPLYAGLLSSRIAAALLGPVAGPGEVDATQRGMPHNVTTQMDLELWRVAVAALPHRTVLLESTPEELAERFSRGDLPEIGLRDFLARYGHRCAAEIDVGVPRWAEDPKPIFAALSGYLRLEDPEQAPDHRFTRAAIEAEEALDRLIGRAMRTRPLRAAVAGFLLRRSRELAGLRELPKFVWLYPLREVRRQLLLAGAALADLGLLHQADDIMFLTLDEAAAAAEGSDQRELAATRRAEHQLETQRTRVPGLLLSDGTMPQNLPDDTARHDENTLVGMPAAAGIATGRARIVHDPATARIEPGDILVTATTDPGWSPLFLTAGGLVTETGSPMAHGPTVAREYGIPAVICVPDATNRLHDGQMITVDGSSGTVQLVTSEERGARR